MRICAREYVGVGAGLFVCVRTRAYVLYVGMQHGDRCRKHTFSAIPSHAKTHTRPSPHPPSLPRTHTWSWKEAKRARKRPLWKVCPWVGKAKGWGGEWRAATRFKTRFLKSWRNPIGAVGVGSSSLCPCIHGFPQMLVPHVYMHSRISRLLKIIGLFCKRAL